MSLPTLSLIRFWRRISQRSSMSAAEEQRIARAKAELRRIRNAMEASGNNHGQHMNAARAVITAIDSTGLMQRPNHIKDQIFIISRLQKLAYFDADSGGVRDIADWCVNQWLRLLQRDGQNVDALHGTLSLMPLYVRAGWMTLIKPRSWSWLAVARTARPGEDSSRRSQLFVQWNEPKRGPVLVWGKRRFLHFQR